MSSQLTWIITGTSSGFGEIFVKQILARGDKVIATARSLSKIQHLKDAGASTLELDVTAPQSVLDAKSKEAIAIYGRIDVLVNNAGYCGLGTLEDVNHETWVQQYNTNVFGAVDVTRAFMPHFREKKAGTVIFVGSIAGWAGSAAAGPYCSSKFALQGIAESFAAEAAPLGIKSMVVEPGLFRTSFLKPDNTNFMETQFAEYKEMTEGLYGAMAQYNGKQPGDPEKGVAAILDVVKQEGKASGRGMPGHLLLGTDAVATVRKECLETLELLKKWEDISSSTDLSE
ncbi:putative oxidoreductase [Lachnellula suecica]|uniref:Putative oxidoreductase n=1 Tax=Lachnellula suecica TaxID=602035 RepID=A0A8T9C9V1_9HELO|nr:putative oxidoreductase [Lachnellula suecica]